MRKLSLTFLLVSLIITLPAMLTFAQEGQGMSQMPVQKANNIHVKQSTPLKSVNSIFAEDFSSGSFPPAGWTIVGGGDANWVLRNTVNAGGAAPEISFGWGPPYFNGNSKLVTPEIPTAGYSSLLLEFNHFVWDFAGSGYSYKVETTSDGGITWNEVWSVSPTGDIPVETLTLLIDNDDVGSDNFQLAFTFDGNSTQINYWYLDDIILSNGSANTYTVTYNIKDEDENPIEGAQVYMPNGGTKITDASGQAIFTGILPGTHSWNVAAAGFAPKSGEVTITDEDVVVDIIMEAATELLYQAFAGGTFPPEGWSLFGDNQSNWSRINSANAGGEYPEARFSGLPVFSGNSKLVSPIIATSTETALFLGFKHFLSDISGSGYSLKIETTSDGGTTWNEVWSVSPTGDMGPESQDVLISTDDVGSDNFQFAFTFEGNSAQIENWFIDDVRLTTALTYDAGVATIDIPSLAISGLTMVPAATVVNSGSETITFDVTLEIIAGTTVYSELLTVTDLAPLETETVLFPDWTAIAGSYVIEVKVNLVGDENLENDMISKTLEVADELVPKRPMYEMFTSSTCPPCVAANEALDAILGANPDEYSLVKYQMNWPGAGDPYYTAEGGVRSDYYSIVSVPSLLINSAQFSSPVNFTQDIFDQYQNAETALAITITEALIDEENNISVSADLTSVISYAPGLSAHIVVVEKLTVENVGTNGETEFHNVMMKMLPDASGTTLGEISTGVPLTISESYDMDLTNMETSDDLAVIVFVQNDIDKNIVQSAMKNVTFATGVETNLHSQESIKLYPNPASDRLLIESFTEIQKIEMYNQVGQLVKFMSTKGNTLNLKISDMKSGIYFVKVFSQEGVTTRRLVVK